VASRDEVQSQISFVVIFLWV